MRRNLIVNVNEKRDNQRFRFVFWFNKMIGVSSDILSMPESSEAMFIYKTSCGYFHLLNIMLYII